MAKVTQGSLGNASRTSVVFTVPALAQAGDEVVLQIGQDGNGTAPSTPGGWAQVSGSPQAGGGGSRQSCYVYTVQASDVPGTTTYTFTWTTADFSSVVYIVWRGIDNATPQDVAAGKGTVTVTACVITGVTTVTPNAVCIVLENEQSVGDSHTGPGTEEIDIDGGSLYDFIQASPGATGNQTVTLSGASGGGGFLVALRPAALGARPSPQPLLMKLSR